MKDYIMNGTKIYGVKNGKPYLIAITDTAKRIKAVVDMYADLYDYFEYKQF